MAKPEIENSNGIAMDRAVRALERLGLVIGAVAANQFGDADLPAKAKRLRHMGFTNGEIAQMLSSTANSVGVALHRGRARSGRRRKTASRKRR
jgi:hypothetical protein